MEPQPDHLSSPEAETPVLRDPGDSAECPPASAGTGLSPPPPDPSQLPTVRSQSDTPLSLNTTSSSTSLDNVNAARWPPQPPLLTSRSSGLSQDIQAKMKAFSLSRQGAPPNTRLPASPAPQSMSSGNLPTLAGHPPGGALVGGIAPPIPIPASGPASGALAGGLANLRGVPPNMRPQAPHYPSDPGARISPKGGLAAKRGLNRGGGLKLSDATGPLLPSGQANSSLPTQQASTEGERKDDSLFSKYSEYVDTKTGTLNFKNKAVIHGRGIDFSGGHSFSISLDEVDTLDELGKGNYGTVYKVRHSRPSMRRPGQGLAGNRPHPSYSSPSLTSEETPAQGGLSGVVMAMKEIRLELDEAKFAAIIMELDVLHRCVSPFIIDFYGAFFQEGGVYICMEFMDGGSIDKLYGDGVPENVLRKITLSTVMGLKCLKDDHKIIHRDVKPTNILVNTRGQVKICDFGVSGNLVASIARTNIGCQSYMAPERISGGGVAQAGAGAGGGTYSVQSDIWSLALTIIECAMGRYPYPPETYNNIFSQLSAIVDGDPPDLPANNFSEAAHDFVHGCLKKIPKLRPTYAMLLRHAWLAPLMKPPTISEEDEESEEAGEDVTAEPGIPETADKEVASWVKDALEKRRNGSLGKAEKPALHAVPLDAVPGSPLLPTDVGREEALAQAPVVDEIGGGA